MARTDRTGIAAVLDRARSFALDIEGSTSPIPLRATAPPPDEAELWMVIYDAIITDGSLRQATRKLFRDGHYSEAVGKAFMVVNNTVKTRANTTHDGVDLMNHAFGEKAPVLAISPRKTESQRNEHNGYRSIFSGSMLGIRNPRHHEDLQDEPDSAMEMLVMANHLLRVANRAKRTRARKKATTP
jgi:uncharacterized protein (TIGR02391 family)